MWPHDPLKRWGSKHYGIFEAIDTNQDQI
jgi:hypothetical protein